jgi:hypothetical protein
VLKIFDLAQTLRSFLARFVRASQIFSLLRSDFVSGFHFFDHGFAPREQNIAITFSASIRFAL